MANDLMHICIVNDALKICTKVVTSILNTKTKRHER